MQLEAALERADQTIQQIGVLIEGVTPAAVPNDEIRNELVNTLHSLSTHIGLASASVLAMIEAMDGEKVERAHLLLCRHIATATKALPLVEAAVARS